MIKEKFGITAIIFDKDNTLTAPYSMEIHKNAEEGLRNALNVFGHDHVAILSNSAGTKDDLNHLNAKLLESSTGISVIKHNDKKPGGIKDVLDHFEDISTPSQLCIVGDRLLT